MACITDCILAIHRDSIRSFTKRKDNQSSVKTCKIQAGIKQPHPFFSITAYFIL